MIQACIELSEEQHHSEAILHTTQAMQVALGLYLRLGFRRSEDLDISQQESSVYGFKLILPR